MGYPEFDTHMFFSGIKTKNRSQAFDKLIDRSLAQSSNHRFRFSFWSSPGRLVDSNFRTTFRRWFSIRGFSCSKLSSSCSSFDGRCRVRSHCRARAARRRRAALQWDRRRAPKAKLQGSLLVVRGMGRALRSSFTASFLSQSSHPQRLYNFIHLEGDCPTWNRLITEGSSSNIPFLGHVEWKSKYLWKHRPVSPYLPGAQPTTQRSALPVASVSTSPAAWQLRSWGSARWCCAAHCWDRSRGSRRRSGHPAAARVSWAKRWHRNGPPQHPPLGISGAPGSVPIGVPQGHSPAMLGAGTNASCDSSEVGRPLRSQHHEIKSGQWDFEALDIFPTRVRALSQHLPLALQCRRW